MKQKFYICKHCGNIIAMVRSCGVPVYCCDEIMQEITPVTAEISAEKHVPVYKIDGNAVIVTVGSVEHPMNDAHYIERVYLQTRQGVQYKWLKPGDVPKVCFSICEDDKVQAVYAFCNQHSLWEG